MATQNGAIVAEEVEFAPTNSSLIGPQATIAVEIVSATPYTIIDYDGLSNHTYSDTPMATAVSAGAASSVFASDQQLKDQALGGAPLPAHSSTPQIVAVRLQSSSTNGASSQREFLSSNGIDMGSRGIHEAERVGRRAASVEGSAVTRGNRNSSAWNVGLHASAASSSDQTIEAARRAHKIGHSRVREEEARIQKGMHGGSAPEARCVVRVEVPKGAVEGSFLSVDVPGGLKGADGEPHRVLVAVPPGCKAGEVLEAVVAYRAAYEAEVLAKMARLRREAEAKLREEAKEYEYAPDGSKDYEYTPAAAQEKEYVYKG